MEDTKFIGRIYKISSPHTTQVYIGSTTKSLNQRLSSHRTDYKRFCDGINTIHTRSFDVLKHDDVVIELVYEGLFDTRADLYRLEGATIQEFKNACNKLIAGRTRKEYLKTYTEENREFIHQQKKMSYQRNKDITIVQAQQYYQDNTDKCKAWKNNAVECSVCGHSYTNANKARHEKTQKHQSALSLSHSSID